MWEQGWWIFLPTLTPQAYLGWVSWILMFRAFHLLEHEQLHASTSERRLRLLLQKLSHVQAQYISDKLTCIIFIFPFLSDDVTKAPGPWLVAAVACCAAEALPRFCWTFAITQWDRMHSQGSCFIHPGLYRSLEPTGLPQAVSTLPSPRTVVQTYRWVMLPGPKKVLVRKMSLLSDNPWTITSAQCY